LADFNLVYTENARRHLISEGLSHRFIYVTGSPMLEVLNSKMESIDSSTVLDQLDLESGKYFIVSVHREENVDHPDNLRKVVDCLNAIHDKYGYPVVVSTHPRTKNRLEKLNLDAGDRDIRFLKPFGFFDYNKLQKDSFCAISDSGTISEESAMLDFSAVTLRNSIERPEALDAGSIVMSGLNPDILLDAIDLVVQEGDLYPERETPDEYQVQNTSLRVVKLILGTAKLTSKWRNLDDFSRYEW